MNEEIAIICTLAELTDYGTQNDTVRVFAANFSVAEVDARNPSDLAKVLLQPWQWTLDATIPVCLMGASGQKVVSATILKPPSMAPASTPDAFDTLRVGLNSLFADVFAHADPSTAALFAWSPTDPGTQANPVKDSANGRIYQPWSHVLAHLSTYAAPLPQNLNLVVFFSVPQATLVGYDTLLAAPTFSVTFPSAPAPGTIVVAAPTSKPVNPPTATNTDPNSPKTGWSWAYASVVASSLSVDLKVHQPGLTITRITAPVGAPAPAPVPDGTLDINALWIKPIVEDSNEDWRTTLESRVAETFDLGRQVITALQSDPLKQLFAPPARKPHQDGQPDQTDQQYATIVSDFRSAQPDLLDKLRNFVVALLRDAVDLGLRFAPDRYTLLQYVLERVSVATPVSQNTINTFTAALTAADQSYAPAVPYAPNYWLTQLAAILTTSVPALQTIIPPPVGQALLANQVLFTNPNYDTVVRALADLQKLLAQDAQIATILFSEWGRILGSNSVTSADWTNLATTIEAELTKLVKPGTLRKRMLLANLGGTDKTLVTWSRIIKMDQNGANERQQIRDNILAALMSYLDSRLGIPDPADVNDASRRTPYLPQFTSLLPATMPTLIKQQVALAAKAAGDILPLSTGEPLPPGATQAPDPSEQAHPAILRVSATAPAAAADGDPLRDIAGVGMLLRHDSRDTAHPEPWSCLTTATLRVRLNTQPDETKWPVAASIGFTPHRLIVRNNLLQAALNYKNRPLGSGSPDDAMTNSFRRDSLTQESYDTLIEAAYAPNTAIWNDPTQLDAWAHIPGLKYGAWYDAAAFIIRSSGALPRELTMAPGAIVPGSGPFAAPILPLPPANCVPPAAKVANFQYRRRTPVGHIRFAQLDGEQEFTANSLPAIPSTVAPLARELDPTAVPGVPPGSTPEATLQGVRSTIPLLLQWDSAAGVSFGADQIGSNQFVFKVRPPATSFQVWDRWIALQKPGDPDLTWTRAAVYADTRFHAPKDVTEGLAPTMVSEKSAKAIDLSINDPAVLALCFTLNPLASASSAPTPIYISIPKPAALPKGVPFNAGDGLAQVQGNYIKVTVRSGQAAGAKLLTVDASGVTINIPKGEVWKLEVAPAIDPNEEYRFDESAIGGQFSGGSKNYANGSATESLVPSSTPLQMLIEHAQTCQLTPEDLWRSLQVAPPSTDSTALTVSVTPVSQPSSTVAWHLVRGIELQRQVWRWTGRPPVPLNPPPTSSTSINGIGNPLTLALDSGKTATLWQPVPAMCAALNWETAEFAERAGDATATKASVIFSTPIAADGTLSQAISRQDLSNDLRAQYYRFSAYLYSRYDGLDDFKPFDQGDFIGSQITFGKATTQGNEVDGYTPWVRGFVPCRILPPPSSATAAPPSTLPKPKILLCIPLTAPVQSTSPHPAANEQSAFTSLLVIADEPWYQVAGLAEQMEAAIDDVSISPGIYPRDTQGRSALQIAPDPTIYTSAFTQTVPDVPWLGRPVGTTFDEASSTPLLANTALQFLTPLIPGLGPLDWYMLKVKFRRSAKNSMSLNIDPKIDDAHPQLVSAYTESTWVEFVPSSDHFATTDNQSVSIDDLTFTFDAAHNNALNFINSPADGPTGPVSLRSGPLDTAAKLANLELWAILMQSITDAGGLPGEIYLDHYRISSTVPQIVQNPSAVTHLYLVEVQRSQAAPTDPPVPPTGTWLNELFPNSSTYPPAPTPPVAITNEPDTTQDVLYRALRISGRVQKTSGI
jgi:hypothetical protein